MAENFINGNSVNILTLEKMLLHLRILIQPYSICLSFLTHLFILNISLFFPTCQNNQNKSNLIEISLVVATVPSQFHNVRRPDYLLGNRFFAI